MRALKVRRAKHSKFIRSSRFNGGGNTYGNHRWRVTRAFLPGRIEADHLYVVVFRIKCWYIRVDNDIRNRAQ